MANDHADYFSVKCKRLSINKNCTFLGLFRPRKIVFLLIIRELHFTASIGHLDDFANRCCGGMR